MNNMSTIEDINMLRGNIKELENWKASVLVKSLILDASILKTKDQIHGMDVETTSMMDIFFLVYHPQNKQIMVIEPNKYAPSDPSSWNALYKYIQLAALQSGTSLGVNKVGKSLVYYNFQCKRERLAQCTVR